MFTDRRFEAWLTEPPSAIAIPAFIGVGGVLEVGHQVRGGSKTGRQAYHDAGSPVSRERHISALTKKRFEVTGPLNTRESPEHILSMLECAERVDMLTLGKTAFSPERPASH